MARIVEITNCFDCKFLEEDGMCKILTKATGANYFNCDVKVPIPCWCPLPVAPRKIKKTIEVKPSVSYRVDCPTCSISISLKYPLKRNYVCHFCSVAFKVKK